jgi:hypothetical protein
MDNFRSTENISNNILDGERKTIFFAAAAEVASPNWNTSREHRAAITSRVRIAIQSVVENIPAPNWPNYHVIINRVGANKMDDDNLIAACKPARDQIAQWLDVDDGDERINFEYSQHPTRELDVTRTRQGKTKFRTWLEVTVSREPGEAHVELPRRAPPMRLERERTRAPIRVDQDKRTPIFELELAPRHNGSRVRASLIADIHGERINICSAYTQQGHMWRTQGVSLDIGEVDALISALGVLKGKLREGLRGVPPGVKKGAEAMGGGSDTSSNDVNNITGTERPFPGPNIHAGSSPYSRSSPREYSSPRPSPLKNPTSENLPPAPPGMRWDGKKWVSQHLNPKPPPLPKAKRPPPPPPHANAAAHAVAAGPGLHPWGVKDDPPDCNATAEDADNGGDGQDE